MGRVEFEIRRVPGVLSCQFNATEVLVLVDPEADAAAVTAAVQGILASAAEPRPLSVVGGRVEAAPPRRWGLVLAGAAAASLVAATAAAAATGGVDVGGLLPFSFGGHSHHPVASPARPQLTSPHHAGGTRPATNATPPPVVMAPPTTTLHPAMWAFSVPKAWGRVGLAASHTAVPQSPTPAAPPRGPSIIHVPLSPQAPSSSVTAGGAPDASNSEDSRPGDPDRVGDAHEATAAEEGHGQAGPHRDHDGSSTGGGRHGSARGEHND